MPLNPIIAQQIDSLMLALRLDDAVRSTNIKENLAAAIIDVANSTDVKDDSKNVRIEAHFNILLDKFLHMLNIQPAVSDQVLDPKKLEKQLQILKIKLSKFKKDLLQDEEPPMTLDVLQDRYSNVLQELKESNQKLLSQLNSIRRYAASKNQEIRDKIAGYIQELGTGALSLQPVIGYTALFDSLAEQAKSFDAPQLETYFKTRSNKLNEFDDIKTMQRWLKISGANEVNDINEDMLKFIAQTANTQSLSVDQLRNGLAEYAGIESMLAAILLTVGKEQSSEYFYTTPMKITVIERLFDANMKFSGVENLMREKVNTQQILFLEAIQWRTFISDEQFMASVQQLQNAVDLPIEDKVNIEKLIRRDANLHSADATLVNGAKKSLHDEEMKSDKPYQWFKSLYASELAAAAKSQPTVEQEPPTGDQTPDETTVKNPPSHSKP